MDLTGKLKRGMRIVGADRTDYGTVERYDDETVYVQGRPLPYSAFERVDHDHLYLRHHRAQYLGEIHEARATVRDDRSQEGEVRIPLVEERLEVGTRAIELGDVEIRKVVETEHVSVPIVLRRDQIDLRLVDIDERPIALHEVPDAFTQDVIRVPVRGEEAIISKEAVVTGEVAVSRTEVSERQTISETVRQVAVEVTPSYDQARMGFREHFERTQARLQQLGEPTFRARDFADAEAHYRAGFEARQDPRNAQRSFEDVEDELRARHLAGGNSRESWEADREALRTGWERGE